MKPLSEMTREELWASSKEQLSRVSRKHSIALCVISLDKFGYLIPQTRNMFLECLDRRRLELQDKAAK